MSNLASEICIYFHPVQSQKKEISLESLILGVLWLPSQTRHNSNTDEISEAAETESEALERRMKIQRALSSLMEMRPGLLRQHQLHQRFRFNVSAVNFQWFLF